MKNGEESSIRVKAPSSPRRIGPSLDDGVRQVGRAEGLEVPQVPGQVLRQGQGRQGRQQQQRTRLGGHHCFLVLLVRLACGEMPFRYMISHSLLLPQERCLRQLKESSLCQFTVWMAFPDDNFLSVLSSSFPQWLLSVRRRLLPQKSISSCQKSGLAERNVLAPSFRNTLLRALQIINFNL